MRPPAKKGLLLINLGTPDAPTTGAVRRYLREFLSDPRVIDINPLGRWLLLTLFILPRRPRVSAAAYQKIWTDRGSPLLVRSQELARKVALELESEFEVELAMRYGRPSIQGAVDRLRRKGIQELIALPLYPQHAASSTGSSMHAVYRALGGAWDVLPVKIGGAFHSDPDFLEAFAQVGAPVIAAARAQHVLFSFHGLPQRQVRKSDPSGSHCLQSADCCDRVVAANVNCYRAQAFETARALAQRLGLAEGAYEISFQSRLGRTPWIQPYTDLLLPALAKRGVRRLAVMCPSFVADCLETLEEIGIRGRESFVAAGGEELVLVPSLNSHPAWVQAVVRMARRTAA
jgi:protoporphyrin/coproporphyrin ferrochelatase